MLRRTFLVVAVVAAFGVVAMPAVAAKGGNSEAAKKCQKGGWENFVRADQTAFASEKECTSYAAQGGVLTEPYYAPRDLCEDAGYTFSEGLETSRFFGVGPSYFRCSEDSDGIPPMTLSFIASYESSADVRAACTAYNQNAQVLSDPPAGYSECASGIE